MSEWNVFAKITVIVFTASEDPDHEERARALGVRRYMRKPDDYGALADAVKGELYPRTETTELRKISD